jgi:acyl-CoA reductase-like NAD-dependent aldehyde dehydrogenase
VSWEEAIQIENSSEFGNAACVYTTNGGNAEWFINRFRAAMLGVNIGIPVPREPFSFGGLSGTKVRNLTAITMDCQIRISSYYLLQLFKNLEQIW